MLEQPNDIDSIADKVHALSKRNGFHPKGESVDRFVPKQCCNIHGEVSELIEAWRKGNLFLPCDKSEKMNAMGYRPLTCAEEELADIIIRALDVSRQLKIDIASAIHIKHSYNATRPYRHGDKKS